MTLARSPADVKFSRSSQPPFILLWPRDVTGGNVRLNIRLVGCEQDLLSYPHRYARASIVCWQHPGLIHNTQSLSDVLNCFVSSLQKILSLIRYKTETIYIWEAERYLCISVGCSLERFITNQNKQRQINQKMNHCSSEHAVVVQVQVKDHSGFNCCSKEKRTTCYSAGDTKTWKYSKNTLISHVTNNKSSGQFELFVGILRQNMMFF